VKGKAGDHHVDEVTTTNYVAVIVVEVVILCGLWAFGRYFGSV